MAFCELEEGSDGDAVAFGAEAAVVLPVGLCLGVVGVEAAEAVVVGSSALSEGIGEGESEVAPGGVSGGDVGGCGFDAGGDGLDVGFNGSGIVVPLRRCWLYGVCFGVGVLGVEPFEGVEFIGVHGVVYL